MKEKEEVDLSDSDMFEDEGLVATAVKYSATRPVQSPIPSNTMGFSK